MSTSQSPPNQKTQPSFEFTKRKKFADLLIAELAEAIILVLSLECRVLFCGAGVTELLGWRDEDLVDGDLIELINGEWIYVLICQVDKSTKRRTNRFFGPASMNQCEQGTSSFVMFV
jgi:hypothetical protein